MNLTITSQPDEFSRFDLTRADIPLWRDSLLMFHIQISSIDHWPRRLGHFPDSSVYQPYLIATQERQLTFRRTCQHFFQRVRSDYKYLFSKQLPLAHRAAYGAYQTSRCFCCCQSALYITQVRCELQSGVRANSHCDAVVPPDKNMSGLLNLQWQ